MLLLKTLKYFRKSNISPPSLHRWPRFRFRSIHEALEDRLLCGPAVSGPWRPNRFHSCPISAVIN